MITIYKYPLTTDSPIRQATTIRMPKDSNVIKVGVQNNQICLWAIVNTENPEVGVTFKIYGTGHELAPETETCYEMRQGTVMIGPFVWHVFEVVNY